jgi:HSP20 family protein
MMSLTRWDPFRELEDMSARLSRLVGQPGGRVADGGPMTVADWSPAVDVTETDAEYLIKADLPAVKKEDVSVEIRDGVISVRGERQQEKEEKGKRLHRVERAYGMFERRMGMPADVDATKVAAEFKDGVLQVHLPKSPTSRPQAVAVKIS